jgi:hypothetical protein
MMTPIHDATISAKRIVSVMADTFIKGLQKLSVYAFVITMFSIPSGILIYHHLSPKSLGYLAIAILATLGYTWILSLNPERFGKPDIDLEELEAGEKGLFVFLMLAGTFGAMTAKVGGAVLLSEVVATGVGSSMGGVMVALWFPILDRFGAAINWKFSVSGWVGGGTIYLIAAILIALNLINQATAKTFNRRVDYTV